MSREWFPHDIGARNDSKILALRRKHGARGVGVYFMLLEIAYEHGGSIFARDDEEIETLEFDLREEGLRLMLETLVGIGLLEETEKGVFSSARIKEELSVRTTKTEARKAAAMQRWSKSDANAMQKHMQSTCNAMPLHNITLHNSTLHNNLAANAPASAREAGPPETPPKPKPDLIPGCDIARATPEALERFCRDHPDPEMRKHYLDQIDVWLGTQKKAVQLGCCIKRLRNWIARNQREKRDWFATNGPPGHTKFKQLPPPKTRLARNLEILGFRGQNGQNGDTEIFSSAFGGVASVCGGSGDSSSLGRGTSERVDTNGQNSIRQHEIGRDDSSLSEPRRLDPPSSPGKESQ